jgi:L-cysteine/cystine lyase
VNLDAIRAELPMLDRCAYLNSGTFGPLPRRAADAMAERGRRNLEEGRHGQAYFEEAVGARAALRRRVGRLLGADGEAIAVTSSTTDGCNIVVAGLRLAPGDEVVTTDVEHPGLLGALKAWRLDVRVARVSERRAADAASAFAEVVTARTRLIALSHVAWSTGQILPVHELTGGETPVLVDGAQSVGAIPVDVRELGCDFYTVSGQKWLLGPDATGCLYVAPEWWERLELTFPSFLSWEYPGTPGTLEPWPDARRFEPLFTPTASVEGLLAAIDFAEEAGASRYERARATAERLRAALAERFDVRTEPRQATLVSFVPNGPAPAVVERLAARGVVVRDLPGLGWVRASCGFWTSDDELDRLLAGL